jgi:anti-sigma factor RsiW
MRCEKIQELILTDYMDRELAEKGVREVDAHILSCAACREFKRLADRKAAQPFKAAPSVQAPSYIWERVKQEITVEHPGMLAGAADIIRNIFWSLGRIPKPAVAFAAAAVVIIAILVARPIAQTRAANEYMAEQIDFMLRVDVVEANGNEELF